MQLDVVRARVYTHHSRLAARFVVGRVLLAGDAAHLMPPWAGQGMNTGFRDAPTWPGSSRRACAGRPGPALLATYEKERRVHARSMIDLSTRLGRILSPTRVSTAFTRDVMLRAATIAPAAKSWVVEMRFKPLPRYEDGLVVPGPRARREPPSVGRMFIQPDVELDGRCVKLDDVLGRGFAVLGFECDPAGDLDDARPWSGWTTWVRPSCGWWSPGPASGTCEPSDAGRGRWSWRTSRTCCAPGSRAAAGTSSCSARTATSPR